MTPMKDIALFPNYEEGWGAQHKTEIVARWNKHLENFKQECRGKGDCRESRTVLRNMRDALPAYFSVIYHKNHFWVIHISHLLCYTILIDCDYMLESHIISITYGGDGIWQRLIQWRS